MKKDGWSDPYHQIMSTFSERDQDGDGYLTPQEMEQAVACNRIKDTFQERNGQLNYEEFVTFVERMLLDHGLSQRRAAQYRRGQSKAQCSAPLNAKMFA